VLVSPKGGIRTVPL